MIDFIHPFISKLKKYLHPDILKLRKAWKPDFFDLNMFNSEIL